MNVTKSYILAGLMLTASAAFAVAGPQVYYGLDAGVANKYGSMPNTLNARGGWANSVTSNGDFSFQYGFEDQYANSAYKVSHTVTGLGTITANDGVSQYMRIDQSNNDASNGFSFETNKLFFKSTTGGNNRAFTLNFAQPVTAFGTFVTGLGTGAASTLEAVVYYAGGATSTHTITGHTSGGVLFWGINNDGKNILKIVFKQDKAGDSFSFDNFAYALEVPNPSAAMAGAALLGLAAARRRRSA